MIRRAAFGATSMLVVWLRRWLQCARRFGFPRGTVLLLQLVAAAKLARSVVTLPGHGRVRIRPGSSDLSVFEQVFLQRQHDLALSYEPRTIIDAGANVGYAAIAFSLRWPRARILAIEPEASNFAAMAANVAALKNVTVVRAALWPSRGTVAIENPADEKWAFRVTEGPGDVPAITIDDAVHMLGGSADLVKIDIEGSERELFADGAPWLSQVRTLTIELHDQIRRGCSGSLYRAVAPFDFSQDLVGEHVVLTMETAS